MKPCRLLRRAAVLAVFGVHLAVAGASAPVDGARLLDDVRILASSQFEGRRTGSEGSRKARAYLRARFEALGLAPFGAGYAQPFNLTGRAGALAQAGVNMVGAIAGASLPQRVLVVSAHYDHLGVKGGKLYPGADDNASGVAAMLAIAAWFKAHPPRHSVVFAAFDAEEMGLQGARAFVAAPPFPREQLALNINLDMLSHNERNEIFVAGTSYTPALKPLLEQAARRSKVKLRFGHDRARPAARGEEDWTESSDHAPFHAAGIPFLYFGVEDHPAYHTPSDSFERINPAFFTDVANLLVDVAATLDRDFP